MKAQDERYLDREALILRSRDDKEADRLVWIVTAEAGRSVVLARGARKPKARLAGSLQPYALARLVIYDTRWPTVTAAQTISPWRHLREDYEALQAASFVAELLLLAAPEGDEAADAFALGCAAFAALDAGNDPAATAMAFARDLLVASGWGIDFGTCGVCNRPLEEKTYLRAHIGDVTHGACSRAGLAIDGKARAFLGGDTDDGGGEAPVFEAILALWQGHLEAALRTAPALRAACYQGRTAGY